MIANVPERAVFVDLSPLAADGTNGGAAPFVLGLLERLARHVPLRLMVKPQAAQTVSRVVAAGADLVRLGEEVREPRRLRRTLRRAPLLNELPDGASLRRLGAGVLFSPLQTAAFHEPRLPHVAIAYDFQELAFPEFFAPAELRRRAAFRADLARCDRVVAISGFTKDEAIARAGLDPARLEVIPPVVAPRARVPDPAPALARHGLAPRRYALYPANFWPHKNHERLLAALAHAPDVRLVLCGALDAGRARAAERAAALGVGGRVTFLPFLPDEELTALLQEARFLVFPSLFEGFGIPVHEAFQLGVPVACSAIPALTELAGGAAAFFDPEDLRAIGEALARLWSDPPLRERLAAAGAARGAAAFEPEAALARWRVILTP